MLHALVKSQKPELGKFPNQFEDFHRSDDSSYSDESDPKAPEPDGPPEDPPASSIFLLLSSISILNIEKLPSYEELLERLDALVDVYAQILKRVEKLEKKEF